MKKALMLAAFVGLGVIGCNNGPDATKVCMDNNTALAACFPGTMTSDCSMAGMTDGGAQCTNQNDVLTAMDNCATAVPAMPTTDQCTTYTNCLTSALAMCMH